MNLTGVEVTRVRVRNVAIDIEVENDDCGCNWRSVVPVIPATGVWLGKL